MFRIIFGALARVVARYPDLNFHLNEASPPDRAVLARPEVRVILRASIKEAFQQGSAGALQELALLAAPWGFDVEAVATPLHVWHGQLDGVVPHAMGTALATTARGARLRLLLEEGHISLPLRHGAEILGALVSSG